jgi:hypothetical protein
MAISLKTSSQKTALPDSLFYQTEVKPVEQKAHWCWDLLQAPLQSIGVLLRNTFYLPWYAKKVDPAFELNQTLAQKVSSALKRSDVLCLENQSVVKQCFSVRDVPVQLEGATSQIFMVRVFESKMPIEQKKLRLILFSFNGNSEGQGGMQKWNPLTIRALSESPILVLKALEASGVRVDSLMTTSLGNVTLDGLQYLTSKEEKKILPPTLIINRGLTSVWKVARQYPFPINYLLYGAAKLSGWDADPERELLNFLIGEQGFPKRKIVLIEALKDFYFSGEGRFDLDMDQKITKLGHKVFRAGFYPFPFHARAHHALSLDHLVRNVETKMLEDSIPLNLAENETMTSAIVRTIFLSGDEAWHTCFYVCGNDATLDIGTAREALPLLSAFIEEGQRVAQRILNDDKQQAS